MSTKFSMIRDINGYNGFGLQFADDKFDMLLLVGAEQTITIPDNINKWIAIFAVEPGAEAWIALNTTATYPVGAAATTDSEMNPVGRLVSGGDVVHFITPNAETRVGMTLYGLSGNGLQ